MKHLKYPIGEFIFNEEIDDKEILKNINIIKGFITLVNKNIQGVSDEVWNWKYRPDGWNLRQLIHHCADSHMNAFIRTKLALTEDNPVIKPYFEDRWAILYEEVSSSIDSSLKILDGMHERWSDLLIKTLKENKLDRTYFHPETEEKVTLKEQISLYAWHCKHHLAHMELAINSKGKYN